MAGHGGITKPSRLTVTDVELILKPKDDNEYNIYNLMYQCLHGLQLDPMAQHFTSLLAPISTIVPYDVVKYACADEKEVFGDYFTMPKNYPLIEKKLPLMNLLKREKKDKYSGKYEYITIDLKLGKRNFDSKALSKTKLTHCPGKTKVPKGSTASEICPGEEITKLTKQAEKIKDDMLTYGIKIAGVNYSGKEKDNEKYTLDDLPALLGYEKSQQALDNVMERMEVDGGWKIREEYDAKRLVRERSVKSILFQVKDIRQRYTALLKDCGVQMVGMSILLIGQKVPGTNKYFNWQVKMIDFAHVETIDISLQQLGIPAWKTHCDEEKRKELNNEEYEYNEKKSKYDKPFKQTKKWKPNEPVSVDKFCTGPKLGLWSYDTKLDPFNIRNGVVEGLFKLEEILSDHEIERDNNGECRQCKYGRNMDQKGPVKYDDPFRDIVIDRNLKKKTKQKVKVDFKF